MAQQQPLQFAPFSSAVDVGFFHALSDRKLNIYKLDESSKSIVAHFAMGTHPEVPPLLQLTANAFHEDFEAPLRAVRVPGTLVNANTIDGFKEIDKKQLLATEASTICQAIRSGAATANPSLLTRFLVLTFANLKKCHFYYWFAFPAIPVGATLTGTPVSITSAFADNTDDIVKAIRSVTASDSNQCVMIIDSAKHTAHRLSEWNSVVSDDCDAVTLAFADASALATNPGWSLRNIIAYVHACHPKVRSLKVIAFREHSADGVVSSDHSIVLDVQVTEESEGVSWEHAVGWEKNAKGKMAPRVMDLSATMNPAKLAESAVDLNLKLMRWRLMPQLQLEKVAGTRCLLLGAGTLGCNVARNLLGWGVRKITLVDSGRVSYSNPVRQSLFTFEDCVDGGQPKAEQAARMLKTIFPGVDSTGVNLAIPMPGHAVETDVVERETRTAVATLEALIDSHDIVFLLLDTREARWLPSLIACAKGKTIINAALGFNTYVVMRHGVLADDPAKRLGCYFCNDIMAPKNSTRDRTLDQQCTVSRPGISMIAAAAAVELAVSIIHHPKGNLAPADTRGSEHSPDDPNTCPLGLVPHQLRGYLSTFDWHLPTASAFNRCTACSQIVVDLYREKGFDFLLKAFNDSSYLEDVTGLSELHAEAEAAIANWDDGDDEDDFGTDDDDEAGPST